MNLYECEVRFFVDNPQTFTDKLKQLGAKLKLHYEFYDHYFAPFDFNTVPKLWWHPRNCSMRLREWQSPASRPEICFTHVVCVDKGDTHFKRSLYQQGKIVLFQGEYAECERLLSDIGFERWFIVMKRDCTLWELQQYDMSVACEYIHGLGWMAELEAEGEDIVQAEKKLKNSLNLFEVSKDKLIWKPLSVVFAEQHGFLQ